ncbi:MAG: TonB-dependent receptor [Candidatus Stahlbacteria bacterium]|nr:TonB-dependent receptor [Candidatus Stahlbacteria bacterium]
MELLLILLFNFLDSNYTNTTIIKDSIPPAAGFSIVQVLPVGKQEDKATDSIVVGEFERDKAIPEIVFSISDTIRALLGKQFPVLSKEESEKRIISSDGSLDSLGIPVFISGTVEKQADKYLIKVMYLDFLRHKGDTIVIVTDSVLECATRITSFLTRQLKGEPETEYGGLHFESQPSGADILLDGEFIGLTPISIDLVRFGEHSVLVSKIGYKTSIKLPIVHPGSVTTLAVSLTPIPGSLIAPSENTPVYVVDEIVIQGEKVRDELFNVPKGVDILTTRDIEYSGAKTLPDLLSQVSGISVIDKTGSGVASSLSIRGMDPAKYTLVTLDGIVINRIDGEVNWGAIPLEIVKRIEVIKSGTVTPYGGKSAGGVINIVTKKSERNKVSCSSANFKDIGGSMTLTAIGGWTFWLNTSGRYGKGWREAEEYDIRSVYGKCTFPIYDNSSVVFSLDFVKQHNVFPGGLLESELVSPEQSGIDKEKKLVENLRLTSQYETKTGESTFRLKFYTIPQDYKSTSDFAKWSLRGVELGTGAEYRGSAFSLLTEGEWNGVDREVSDIYPDTTDFTANDNSSNFTFRSMFEWEEHLFKFLALTAGAKYEWLGYKIQDKTSAPQDIHNIYTSHLSPKMGLLWTSLDWDIFSSFERTIHPPKSYEKAKNIDLKPEMATSMEFGIRVRGTLFTTNLSLFYIDLRDQILMCGTGFENATSGAFHRGIEGELNKRFTDNVSLFLNHTYIDARFKNSGLYVPQVPTSEGSVGIRLTYMPKYSCTLTYNWYGKSYASISHQDEEDWVVNPYTSLEINFKFKPLPHISLGLQATNILNESGKAYGYEFQNSARYYPISPRGFRIDGGIEF